MDIGVNEPEFAAHPLTFRTAGVFSNAKLIQDGQPLKRERGLYSALGDGGAPVEVKVRYRFLDAIPTLRVAGRPVQLARPLTWYEYLWIALPIALIFIGGALGAVIGFVATYTSGRILRMHESGPVRYALTGTVSVAAVVVFLVLAVALNVMVGR